MTDYFIGEIRMMMSQNGRAPSNWLLCDGSIVNISQYQTLFSLIGTTYGGNGSTTFGLPDLRGRLPVGQGSGPGLTPRIVGQSFGTEGVALTVDNLPAHNHPFNTINVTADTSTIANGVGFANTTAPAVQYLKGGLGTAGGTAVGLANTVDSTGSGQPHNNVMPCATMTFIICCQGNYPMRA